MRAGVVVVARSEQDKVAKGDGKLYVGGLQEICVF